MPNKDQVTPMPLSGMFDFEYQNLPPKGAKKKVKFVDRKIVSGRIDTKLCHNGISTSKYNFVTFIPMNLMEQFSKIANIYFLAIGIMQTIKSISVSGGTPDIFLPLFFIVFISACKDLFEDIRRHRADTEENSKICHVMDPQTGELVKKPWKSVRVGDIIKIEKNEYVPADMLVLLSSEAKGEAFIETKNLDGETNLKHKTIPKPVIKTFRGEGDIEFNHLEKVVFAYEAPNPYLYVFNGSVTLVNEERIPLDSNNFILRGCSLRNTNWIYGVIAYTGHDTKIMLNSVKSRPKKSKLERMLSFQIVIVFGFQVLLCVFCAVYYGIWYEKEENDLDYLDIPANSDDANVSYNIGTRFGNWMIIFSNFVPISLLVTLEMVKFIQGIFIAKDPEMVHKASKTPTTVQSSNLNEELGQIEYVFSDKTGTLTQNYMEFRKLVARGKAFGLDRSIEDISKFPEVTNVNFRDKTFFDALNKNDHAVEEYLMSLAVCHNIITEHKDNEIIYNASSPDELALVNFAKYSGCEYIGMDEDSRMQISFKNQVHKFKLLQVLEFNSKRKRMSVIVEDQKGQILLYCKGADSILLELMKKEKNPDTDITLQHLMEFADEGLRTLLVCSKVIAKPDYFAWAQRYLEACMATENKQDKMEALQEEIEQDILLVGATAIEDKLQDDVGATIAFLKETGIKVWVLTGDKIETAINIGFSCNLLNKDLERLIVDGKSNQEVENSLNAAAKIVDMKRSEDSSSKFALIVSGDALIQAMKDPLSAKMMEIADVCEAVLCCRVAPKQKAEVVTLVRKTKPKVSTLAIGDGANDVNMISAAHIGVGIRGVEGQQAARASDYAFGEFKLLKRLLVHHGRECYRRNCNLILFNFFKNTLLVLPLFWVGFKMAFSGQQIYETWLYSLFNIFFTSLPIVIYSVFDREYTDNSLMEYPFLYLPGIQSKHFGTKRFWLWMLNATCQSVLIGMLGSYIMESTFVLNIGYNLDIWGTSCLLLGLCVVISNLKVATFSYIHSFPSVIIIIGSIGVYIICFFVVNFLLSSTLYRAFTEIFVVPDFYFANIVLLAVTSLMDFGQERYSAIIEYKIIKRLKKAYKGEAVSRAATVEVMVARSVTTELKPPGHHTDAFETPGGDIQPKQEGSPPVKSLRISQSQNMGTSYLQNSDLAPLKMNQSSSNGNILTPKHTGFAFSEEEPNYNKSSTQRRKISNRNTPVRT